MKRRTSISVQNLIPEIPGITSTSKLGLGLDIATTEKETSNPSAIALVEKINLDFIARFILRWKTENPEVTMAIISLMIERVYPVRIRKLCIDATSEKYFAATVQSRFAGRLPVDLVVSSETTEYLGETMTMKAFLGNQLINECDDGHLFLPDEVWVKDDFRLVKRDRGSFSTDVDANGGHGDVFDSVKLGIQAVKGPGGPAQASACQVGQYGNTAQGTHRQLKNPLLHLFRRTGGKVNV